MSVDIQISVSVGTNIKNAIALVGLGFVPGEDILVYPAELYDVSGTYNSIIGVDIITEATK